MARDRNARTGPSRSPRRVARTLLSHGEDRGRDVGHLDERQVEDVREPQRRGVPERAVDRGAHDARPGRQDVDRDPLVVGRGPDERGVHAILDERGDVLGEVERHDGEADGGTGAAERAHDAVSAGFGAGPPAAALVAQWAPLPLLTVLSGLAALCLLRVTRQAVLRS